MASTTTRSAASGTARHRDRSHRRAVCGEPDIGPERRGRGPVLERFNEDGRSFRYTIDDGPGPVAADVVERYVGIVNVFPVTATGGTFVLWRSEYSSKDDGAIGEFCDPIYQALLADLAKHFSP